MPAQCVVCVRNSLLTQFLRLSGMRPGGGKQLHYSKPWVWSQHINPAELQLKNKDFTRLMKEVRHPALSNHSTNAVQSDTDSVVCWRTGNSPTDLPRRLLAHLNRGLLAVPRCMRGADQVGRVFKRTLAETDTNIQLYKSLMHSLGENDLSVRTFHKITNSFSWTFQFFVFTGCGKIIF